ncbi:hypothetical protein KC973_02675 [Candidatus Saccharibacteria bacterium]|nr:hypothetical protein [Candidatus Saccharibacteria bacterium]
MKQVLLIGRNFHPDGKETVTQIAEGLKRVASDTVTAHTVYLKDIVFYISNSNIKIWDSKSGKDLKDFDAVLMTNWFSHASIRKDMALTLALYFDHHRVPQFNSEALHTRSTSKLSQMMLAALNNISMPATVFSLSFKTLINAAKSGDVIADLPVVLKDAQASRGNANYLLKSWEDAEPLKADHTERHPFMAQEFIKSQDGDYRFFVTNGETRFAIHRVGTDDTHLNNTSAGATTSICKSAEFSDDVLQAVSTMSTVLHREVTGLDIMLDESGQYFFLEANPIPQIATGSNIDLKLSALAEGLLEATKEGASK